MTNLPVRWGDGGFEEMEGDPSNGGGEWFWNGGRYPFTDYVLAVT